ncbi:MAG: DNA adenine methylase [Chloroflexi bacterium]|nr:DNA adenine methylase [Chloroflexota bacterium]
MPGRKNRPIPRPFLKWAGGKTSLLPILLETAPPQFGTYYEPFLGGGAFFFALYRAGRIRRAVLGDINQELMDTYQALKVQVDAVISLLDTYPHDRTFYYTLRDQDPWTLSLPARAARMIYLNKTCYNGLYRVNRSGRFNVPFGRHKNPDYRDFENLRAVSRALQQVELRCASFEQVVQDAQPGDFVYFDPPYDPRSRTSNFTQYHAEQFGREAQHALAHLFRSLAERGVWVMLSNADTPFIRALYADFHVRQVYAPRSINSKAHARGPVPELLVTNW